MKPYEELSAKLDEALAAKDLDKAEAALNAMWLSVQVHLAQRKSPQLKELTYLKTPVTTPTGKYLLMFVHVDGQKIQLQETVDAVTKGNESL